MRPRTILLATTLLAMPAIAQEVPLGRLPDTVRPTAYRIDLKVDPAQQDYTGHVEIDAEVKAPTRTVFLHGLGLKIARAEVLAGGKVMKAKWTDVDPSGVARLDLPGNLPAGKVSFRFDYSTGFRTGAEGLFHAKVGEDWYAWTQMEPLDARRMFPGFDEPGFKVPFTVSLTVPNRLKAFANTPEVSVTTSGDWTTHRFAPSRPLPTYLVAVGVGDFDVRAATIPANAVRKTPLEFRVIATKGQAGRMDTTLSETPKIVAILEEYFGIAYPYEKLDFIASPVMGGAMENAGLILFEDTLILLGNAAPPSQLSRFGVVAAHELAHQWFGDLVTPTWWTDIWLNESFAEWMGNKAAHKWNPNLDIAAGELAGAFSAMSADSLGRGRPIRQEITRNDQVISAFDLITYQKGAQTVSMFESFVGEDQFRKGVQLHLNRYAFRNASADDFFASVAEASGNPDLVPAMRSFTDQTGVPLVTVRDSASGLTLSQSRYVPLGIATDRMLRRWQIPLCLSRGEGRRCTLLKDASASVPPLVGTSPALVPNANGAGYYRFSMDGPGWDRLISAAAALPEREAMAVGDSIWAEFAAGRIDFARVMGAAEQLAKHPQRLPAIVLAAKLSGTANTLLPESDIPAYRALMQRLYGSRPEMQGFDPARLLAPGEPATLQGWRESLVPLLALQARDPALRSRLKDAANRYLAGDSAALAPTYRRTALAVAVQDGGIEFADRLFGALKASQDPLFRSQAAGALGSAEGDATVAHVQALAMGEGLLSLERTNLLGTLAANRAARDSTTAFVSANFKKVVESFPGFARAGIIGFFDGYCSPDAISRVEGLIQPNLAVLGGGELELSQTKERIGQCAALKDAKGAEISAALKGR